MKLTVESIPSEGIDINLSSQGSFDQGELEALGSEADVALCRPVSGHMQIYRLDQEVYVNGDLETAVGQTCCRCLGAFELPVHADVSYTFQPMGESQPEEQELKEEDPRISFYTRSEIDLAPIAIEQIQLAIPMKPLCAPECRGLCPACGANRNEGDCGCEEEKVDERFAVLKDFKVNK